MNVDFRTLLRGEYSFEWIKEKLNELVASTRQVNVLVDCKHCGRPGKYDVEVPDNRTRLDALKFISEQGYGKAGQAPPALPVVDTTKLAKDYSAEERAAMIPVLRARLASEAGPQEVSL